MARAAKTPKYNQFNSFANCFGEHTNQPNAKPSDYFNSPATLQLELGCGKAELARALAAEQPDVNFVGVDLKADRLWKAAVLAAEAKLTNMAFLQTNILQLNDYFEPDTVDTIWITFPDPFLKKRQIKHRMLNRSFLDIYKRLLVNAGTVHFKTDNNLLFDWALELLNEQSDVKLLHQTMDLQADSTALADAKHITHYEAKFMAEGTATKYLQFSFTNE